MNRKRHAHSHRSNMAGENTFYEDEEMVEILNGARPEDSQPGYEGDDDVEEIHETHTPVETILPQVHEPPVKKRRVRKPKTIVATSDPNIELEVRDPVGRPRKKVVVYRDAIPQGKVTIVEKTHKKGRPPIKTEVEVEHTELFNRMNSSVEGTPQAAPAKVKKMTVREAKRLELLEKHLENERMRGKQLRQTRKGMTDQRSVGERTEAQKESARQLVIRNKLKREQAAAAKKDETKETVKAVISELSVKAKMKPAPAPAPAPAPEPEPVQTIRSQDFFKRNR